MAETDFHREQIVYLIEALKDHFREQEDVYVAGNLFVYYEEGNPAAVVAPDVFVVFGVPGQPRRIYKVWEEGKGPDVVFEVTSLGTRWQDLGSKKGIYAYLGVREYFLFDPVGEYLQPVLQGYRLEETNYRPIPLLEAEEGGIRLASTVLGLEMRVEEGMLRLYDPATGERLLTPLEAQEARRQEVRRRQQAEARARREAERRRQAEARLKQLEEELARLQGEDAG
ncbi:MAG TPA: Uma2 family endonuclease [Chloroflexi bacterium]|nr:Uma2 family endonuclease [Chloroflexota bacterium]